MKNYEKNGLPEIYRFFKDKFTASERKNGAFVDYKKFSNIIKDFNKELSNLIIKENIEFKMPVRLGFIRIQKHKPKIKLNLDGSIQKKNIKPDWKTTKQLWQQEYPGKTLKELKDVHGKPIVYFLNEHTNGYKYHFFWNKKGSNAKNRSVYSMIFSFTNRRDLSKLLHGDVKIDYYE